MEKKKRRKKCINRKTKPQKNTLDIDNDIIINRILNLELINEVSKDININKRKK